MKILHIINTLRKGGAEGNLYRLCKSHKEEFKNKIEITILTLVKNGYYESELEKLGVKIYSLNINQKNKIFDFLKTIIVIRKFLKEQNPDIIQSWMYHSNFITIFFQNKYYNITYWNIRHSELNFHISKKTTILISIICGLFSKLIPNKIIYCSERSKNFHENKHFYSKKKSKLIDNGFSDKDYFFSENLRLNFRKNNKINKAEIIIGYAGRYARQKNIKSLLSAFSKISIIHNKIYFYMVGKDINYQNKELVQIVQNLNIKDKVFFLNEQKSLLEFYNGIDLLILASHSESFPNVIAESMLCKTPVLSSQSGCSEKIIDKCGFTFINNDNETIYRELIKVINVFLNNKEKWRNIKTNARLRIQENFSILKMSKSYLENWIF